MSAGNAARDGANRLPLGRETPLTLGQEAIHQAIAILLLVRVRQADRMAHLVHDRRQQIDAAGGVTCRFSVTACGRSLFGKDWLALVAIISEPAVAARVLAYTNDRNKGE